MEFEINTHEPRIPGTEQNNRNPTGQVTENWLGSCLEQGWEKYPTSRKAKLTLPKFQKLRVSRVSRKTPRKEHPHESGELEQPLVRDLPDVVVRENRDGTRREHLGNQIGL